MSDPSTATSAEASKEASTTPIFGSASTFGGGSGFAAFTGIDTSKASPGFGSGAAAATEEDEGATAADEEECSAEFKPVVQLEEVEVQTGEEEEEVMADFKCKLYRYDQGSGEWKERGVGQMRLLRHKENDRIRLLMRQDKTLKIRANHIVMPGTRMQEHSGNEKSIVWSAVDFADEEQKTEMFCARFASQDRAKEFIGKHEEAMSHNEKVLGAAEDGGEGEAAEPQAGEADAAEAGAAGGKTDATESLADQVSSVKVTENEGGKKDHPAGDLAAAADATKTTEE